MEIIPGRGGKHDPVGIGCLLQEEVTAITFISCKKGILLLPVLAVLTRVGSEIDIIYGLFRTLPGSY